MKYQYTGNLQPKIDFFMLIMDNKDHSFKKQYKAMLMSLNCDNYHDDSQIFNIEYEYGFVSLVKFNHKTGETDIQKIRLREFVLDYL